MKLNFYIFVQVSLMGERFHIHSSEMEDRKTEMTNMVKKMGEKLTLKIDKNDGKISTIEDLTQLSQEEMTKKLKNIHVKINESKSFQENIYGEFMEQSRLMLEKSINSSISYTKEKFKELLDYLETEKIEHFEVIKLLGLTHSLVKLFFTNDKL